MPGYAARSLMQAPLELGPFIHMLQPESCSLRGSTCIPLAQTLQPIVCSRNETESVQIHLTFSGSSMQKGSKVMSFLLL